MQHENWMESFSASVRHEYVLWPWLASLARILVFCFDKNPCRQLLIFDPLTWYQSNVEKLLHFSSIYARVQPNSITLTTSAYCSPHSIVSHVVYKRFERPRWFARLSSIHKWLREIGNLSILSLTAAQTPSCDDELHDAANQNSDSQFNL